MARMSFGDYFSSVNSGKSVQPLLPYTTVNGADYNNGWWQGGNATATGSVLGSFWNEISGTTQNNVFNSAEAAKQRDWETYMSNTAYQRQVADMKAAGINPAAAHMTNGGAPVPNGSAAHSAAPGNGGLIGLIASIAGPVLGKVVGAKLMAKASSARDAAQAARDVTRESMRAENAIALEKVRNRNRLSTEKELAQYRNSLKFHRWDLIGED